jgi:hypothetical protein
MLSKFLKVPEQGPVTMWRCPRLVEEGRNQTKIKYKAYTKLKVKTIAPEENGHARGKDGTIGSGTPGSSAVPDKSRRMCGGKSI